MAGIVVVFALLYGVSAQDRGQERKGGSSVQVKKLKNNGNVDGTFLKRIRDLLNVVIPTWTCKEAKYAGMLAILICLRTQMSIWLADANGRVVRSIIQGDFK